MRRQFLMQCEIVIPVQAGIQSNIDGKKSARDVEDVCHTWLTVEWPNQ